MKFASIIRTIFVINVVFALFLLTFFVFPVLSHASGNYGLSFSGNGDVNIANATKLNPSTDSASLEMWLKLSNTEGLTSLITKEIPYQEGLIMNISPGGTLEAAARTDSSPFCILDGRTILPGDNKWHHLAVVKSSSTLYVFLDGKEDATPMSCPGSLLWSTNDWTIAGSTFYTDRYLTGYVDEVRFSNIARYTADFTPSTDEFLSDINTIFLYHFSEGSGTITSDSSSNPMVGNIINGGWVTGYLSNSSIPTPTITLTPSASPYSDEIAYYSNRSTTGTGTEEIKLMNADGSNQREITNSPGDDFSPIWSRDGQHILFGSNRDGNYELYKMDADGLNQQDISNNPNSTDYPGTWSPDGSKIAFYSDRTGNFEIYTMNVDGTNVQKITNDPGRDEFPDWSPDGTKIAFDSNRSGTYQIYIINVDGTNMHQLTTGGAVNITPRWSPDGSKIAFQRQILPSGVDSEIYIMNADGTNEINITNNPATDDGPTWSPDGTQIAFGSFRAGEFYIYKMSTDGSNVIQLTTSNGNGANWRPNSSITPTQIPNLPPSINAISNATINEGGTYSTNGSFTDADSTAWTGTVDYGDGSGILPLSISGNNFTLSHIYKDNGTYTVTVTIADDQNVSGQTTTQVTVNNVAPSLGAIKASINPIQVNTSTTVSANFTDAGVLDTHTAVWNWGDNTTSNGTVTESNGSGSVSDAHIYTSAGVYTITLTVTDKDNGSTSQQYQYLVVYDPSAGFVSGSGQITSQAGADMLNTSATGKAKFGVTAKYVGSNTVPTGNTKFTFKNGNIDLNSTSYDWLVVSGNKAYLHGTGTVNGTGSYNFLVTVIDSNPDTFRMKIKDNSTNTVIYDNQAGAGDFDDPLEAIDNGQIQVH